MGISNFFEVNQPTSQVLLSALISQCSSILTHNDCIMTYGVLFSLSRNYTPNQNWACFVCYLRIVNTLKASWGKLSEKLKNGI